LVDFPFVDTLDHWSKGYVEKLYNLNAVEGKTSTTYEPNGYTTRAQVLKIVMLTLGKAPDAIQNSDNWYAGYMSAALRNKWLNQERPNDFVTRAEALKIVFTVAGVTTFTSYTNPKTFSDLNEGTWYYDLINYASSKGYVVGYQSGKFKPGQACTRAEIAKMISKILLGQ